MTSSLIRSSTTMRAVMKTSAGIQGVVMTTLAVPCTPAGFARVQVTATGICGTDVHVAHDEYAHEAPVVMGHEILGRVVEVGDASDESWVGARVACETYFSTCARCSYCRSGRSNLCRQRRSLGSFEDGGFAEFVVLPVGNLHALPDHLGDLDGVLAEPLACVAHCLLDPPVVAAGDRVLVTGPGAMGQLASQVAHAQGAEVLLAGLPHDDGRLAIAADMGIGVTTATVEVDAFDVVIETSGSAAGARSALTAVRRGGRYVQVGIFGKDVTLPFDQVLYKEVTVTSGFASTATSWRRAMSLIEQGNVNLGPLVTQQVPLSEFARALAAAEAGGGLKTVVVP